MRNTRTAATLLVLSALSVAGVLWTRSSALVADVPAPNPAAAAVPPVEGPATVLAAGDVADCGGGALATAALIAPQAGIVAGLGDMAYPDGSADAFTRCYEPAWGPFRERTRPAPGNHDAATPGAAGYHGYFADVAGPAPQGYYSYELGAWHVIVLNSNCGQVGGCGPDSAQVGWLRKDLRHAATGNVLAYWHHPRFSTGQHGDDPRTQTFWEVLQAGGADVVLNGHDHDYQRFAPQTPDGAPSPDGMREFVVGTGGTGLRPFADDRATVEYRQDEHLGVLRLDLEACGYRWSFLPVGGGGALDQGAALGTC